MQQINLYQDSIRTPRQTLGVQQVLIAASVLLCMLAAISTVQWWWGRHAGQKLASLQQERLQVSQTINRLSLQLAASSNDSGLKNAIREKENQLEAKQYVLVALRGRRFGNTQGFADQFTGLARQHLQGIWLTGLYIHAGGSRLDLQGKTYQPELVPRYLQRLAQEPSFQGIEFQTFLMQRSAKSAQVEFDLRSSEKESR